MACGGRLLNRVAMLFKPFRESFGTIANPICPILWKIPLWEFLYLHLKVAIRVETGPKIRDF